MIRTIQIALARHAHNRAFRQAKAYQSMPSGNGWNICVQMALNAVECRAANRLALLINPNSITRAW